MANIVEIVLRGKDELSKTFTQATKSMAGFEKAAKGSLAILGAGATAAVGALASLAIAAIRNADEMGRLAQTVGMPVDAFSRLAHAANQSDVSTESLVTALKAFQKIITQAVTDPASDAAGQLSRMGISLRDVSGSIRPTQEILLDVSDKFKGFRDDASKSTLAMEMFGKSGADIIPLLNQGKAAIEEFGAKANVVSPQMAEQASKLNENIKTLKTQVMALGFTVAQQVLPPLLALTTKLVETGESIKATEARTGELRLAMSYLETAALAVYHSLRFIATVGATAITVAFGAIYDVVMANVNAFKTLIQKLGELGEVWSKLIHGDFKEAAEAAKDIVTAPFKTWGEGIKQALLNAKSVAFAGFDEILTSAQSFKDKMDAIWNAPKGQGGQQDGENAPKPGDPNFVGPLIGGMTAEEFTAAASDRLLKEGRMLSQSTQAWADYHAHLRSLQRDGQSASLSAAGQFFGVMGQLVGVYAKKNHALQVAFAISEAVVNTAQAVTKSMTAYVWPYNLIVGAIVAAAGAAQIAIIAGQKTPSAHGGLEHVPKEQTYLLDKGERVLSPKQNVRFDQMMDDWDSGGSTTSARQSAIVQLNVGSDKLGEILLEWSRDGRLQIHSRAIIT